MNMSKLLLVFFACALGACSIQQLPDNFSRALMNQHDLDITKDSLPSYLVMLDAMVLTYPDDTDFLFAAAKLNGAYAGAFSNSQPQKKRMTEKALTYASRGLCEHDDDFCDLAKQSNEAIQTRLEEDADEDDLPALYGFASAWAGWIQTHTDDWNAIAQVPKVKTLMQWTVTTDPTYDNGTALIYLGVLESQIPPSLGGKPEQARRYFEQAIQQTQGQHFMAKVMFAQHYSRLMYDQELHDSLLNDVIKGNPEREGLTLINLMAQKQAKTMLAESADYFE